MVSLETLLVCIFNKKKMIAPPRSPIPEPGEMVEDFCVVMSNFIPSDLSTGTWYKQSTLGILFDTDRHVKN